MDYRVETKPVSFGAGLFKKSSDKGSGFLKSRIDPNSQEFYKQHPDLAPRNVYLRMGRIAKMDEIRKTIRDFGEPWYVRVYNSLKDIFRKK